MRDVSNRMKERVYDLMTGNWDKNKYPVPENILVEDEFEVGQPCEEWYQEAYDARCRLCEKLGEDENTDVEMIFSNLLSITKYLGIKMFDYGRNMNQIVWFIPEVNEPNYEY